MKYWDYHININATQIFTAYLQSCYREAEGSSGKINREKKQEEKGSREKMGADF